MQTHLTRRQEGLLPFDGRVSALGQYMFTDARQRKEGDLANPTSQKFEFHAPLLLETTL